MADVIWRNEALDDLDGIIVYIGQFDPDAADGIGDKLFTLGESLADFPRRGRPAADGTREMVTVPPFVLRYEVDGERVFILPIRHGARQPSSDRVGP